MAVIAKKSLMPSWVWYWTLIASILVGLDTVYVFSLAFGSYAPSFLVSLWGWYGSSDAQYSQDGINDGFGWVQSQSIFNFIELCAQLIYLLVLKPDSPHSLLLIMSVSIATLWKTLLYMTIIVNSADPVKMVPGLFCLGYTPLPQNQKEVALSLEADSCKMQFFKFHFNFYWIIVPSMIIVVAWNKITEIMNSNDAMKNKRKA